MKERCRWVNENNELYVTYHDEQWGVPVHQDNLLFEMLILEGAQAGLSWETILKKRENYRKAFRGFDPAKVAKLTDAHADALMLDEGIVRNRLKIRSAEKPTVPVAVSNLARTRSAPSGSPAAPRVDATFQL